MEKQEGYRVWVIPDGDLPPPGEGEIQGHESLVIMNTGSTTAEIELQVFFEESDPQEGIILHVPGKRVRCFRLDRPLGGRKFLIPRGQYALRVESSVPVFVQFGRADVRQPNLAYYCTMGFAVR